MSNPIKPSIKTELLPILLLVITVIASFYFYSRFPDQVPIHWNFKGEVDNWGSRAVGAFLIPGVIAGMYLLFLFLPYLDPKKDRYKQFRKVYHFFKAFLILFMAFIYFLTGFSALGYDVKVGVWIPVLVGLLFILMGNYMSKIKSNWFIGIRTPWTLSSEEVWNKTHRAGGKVFIVAGILMAILPFLPLVFQKFGFIFIICFILLGTIGYSYVLYRKEGKGNLK